MNAINQSFLTQYPFRLRFSSVTLRTMKLFQDLIFDQLEERNSNVCVVSGSFYAFYESKNHLSKKKQFLYQSHCQEAVCKLCSSTPKREKICYAMLKCMKNYMDAEQDASTPFKPARPVCSRCSKEGHDKSMCIARHDASGKTLPPLPEAEYAANKERCTVHKQAQGRRASVNSIIFGRMPSLVSDSETSDSDNEIFPSPQRSFQLRPDKKLQQSNDKRGPRMYIRPDLVAVPGKKVLPSDHCDS
jgi:hypothetical protein